MEYQMIYQTQPKFPHFDIEHRTLKPKPPRTSQQQKVNKRKWKIHTVKSNLMIKPWRMACIHVLYRKKKSKEKPNVSFFESDLFGASVLIVNWTERFVGSTSRLRLFDLCMLVRFLHTDHSGVIREKKPNRFTWCKIRNEQRMYLFLNGDDTVALDCGC